MECKDCGTRNKTGAYFCSGCGRPMGFEQGVRTATEDTAGLEEVPAPGPSAEPPPPPEDIPARKTGGRALCSMCMGSFPETVMAVVDGRTYCPDCTPVTAHRSEPVRTGPDPFGYRAAAEYVPGSPAAPVEMRRGGKRWALGLAGLVLLGGGIFWLVAGRGSGRIDRMLAGVDGARPDARLLVSRYREGERLDYDVRAKLDMDMDGDSGPLGSLAAFGTVNMDITGTMNVDVLSVSGDGDADLRVTLSDFRVGGKAKVNGREVSITGAGNPFSGLNGTVTRMRVDAFGEPLDDPEGPDAAGVVPGLSTVYGGRIAGVPRHELRVGDTWKRTQPLHTVNGISLPGSAVAVEFRVEGYKKLGGRDCMVISMRGGRDGSNPPSLRGLGKMDMDLDLAGVMFFDYEAGCMRKMAMDMDVEMSISGPSGSISAEAHMEMDIDLR